MIVLEVKIDKNWQILIIESRNLVRLYQVDEIGNRSKTKKKSQKNCGQIHFGV